MESIVQAKDRQAAEANKNASILLEELDLEKVGLLQGFANKITLNETFPFKILFFFFFPVDVGWQPFQRILVSICGQNILTP